MRQSKVFSFVCILFAGCSVGFLAAGSSGAAQDAPAALPTLWLIGDSTVRNGQDKGDNGQWGWGNPIAHYFDKTKIKVQNKALGGTSSRSFQSNNWPKVVAEMKPGDFLILQFGHNDSGTPRGNGDEVKASDNPKTGKKDELHTFGWYIRKYVTDAREKKAAEVVVCSLIPRNRWTDGKINRDTTYAVWSAEAAKQEKALYVDLNKIICDRYDALGQKKVTDELFPDKEVVHPDWAGAVMNAECVIDGLKKLDNSQLVKYLLPEPPKDLKNPTGKAR